ncbi:MAG: hypothetical protein IJO64_03825 [Clostridia bacterium]|nr:hypothetical protein [Clostridia bacterium]
MEQKYSSEEIHDLLYSHGKFDCRLSRNKIENIMANSYEHFSLLCLALKTLGEERDFELLEKFINDSDHRKRYIALDYVLYFEKGKEKYAHLVNERLKSNDIFTLTGALSLVKKHKLMQNNNRILEVYELHIGKVIHCGCVCPLRYIHDFESNYERIIALYRRAPKSTKECFSKLLTDLADYSRFDELFSVFANDAYHKVRISAVKLAIKHNRFELLEPFITEKDGHIRKLALKYHKSV